MSGLEVRFAGRFDAFALDVDITLPGRGVTALFGPSGCGKTTLLRCIAGLQRFDDGRLSVNGALWQEGRRFTPVHKRPLGYVFQEASLFAHLSVRENLLYGAKRAHKGAKFNEMVDLLGIGGLLDRAPKRLSGGERQRVAIGRALLTEPDILLMDEPLAALDRFNKEEILPYLERLHGELDIPMVYVSHDIAEVERLADHLVLMDKGKVRAHGPLWDLLNDPTLPLSRMPDAASVLEGKVSSHDATYGLSTVSVRGADILVPGPVAQKGALCRLRIAASDVALMRPDGRRNSSILNALPARITGADADGEFRVTVYLCLADSTGAKLLARISRKSWEELGLQVGEDVTALVKGVALAKTA